MALSRHFSWIIGVALLLPTVVMAKSVPKYMSDPSHEHPDFPKSAYICGVGGAAKSASAGDAERAARGEVARQIRSHLQGEASTVLATSIRDKNASFSQDFEEKIVEVFELDESLMTAIQTVEVRPPSWRKKEYLAYVCLSREEAAQVILARMESERSQFQRAVSLAVEESQRQSVSGFTVQYGIAQQAKSDLMQDWIELRVVSMAEAGQLELEFQQLNELHRIADEWRATFRVGISLQSDDLSDAQLSQVIGAIQGGLQALGLSTVVTDRGCEERPQPTHHLRVQVQALCGWGSLGHSCNPVLAMTLISCSDGQQVGRGQINDKILRGVDGRDINRALAKALDKIDEAALKPHLSKTLGNAIPTTE